MPKQVIAEMERRMKASMNDLAHDLGTLRTGRAAPALLDKVMVEYYGSQTPLNQLATITAPDARQLLISPWDKSVAGAIANAILKSDLGVQATKDGDNVRVSVPTLNEERRKEMVKMAGKKTEAHKVAIRNVRRDANDHLKKMEKDGAITKDELQRHEAEVQKITDRFIAESDKVRAAKEAEIMEV
ncbi:MAG: ribosome recycling factor [Abitibacteriaceae bacterium]|nr:ribosome recycling factor [Abditibacteriaceae bacterium]MBV9867337.1 ribosome recycling factor [Abditibacteriaceae bacterium]